MVAPHPDVSLNSPNIYYLPPAVHNEFRAARPYKRYRIYEVEL